LNVMLKNRRPSPPSLGTMSIAEARAKVAHLKKIAAGAVPVEMVRLNRAANDLSSAIALVEKHKAAEAPKFQESADAKLETGFKRLHRPGSSAPWSDAQALAAARGRDALPATRSLFEAGQRLGLSPASARTFARGRSGISEAATRTEPAAGQFKGGSFPASDYAYVPDANDPETWALLLTVVPGADPDPQSVRAAVQAVDATTPASPNPVPEADLPAVVKKLAKAWKDAGLPVDEMPAILADEALMAGFRRLGHTSFTGLRAAIHGRN
jgi:hypothetical protein